MDDDPCVDEDGCQKLEENDVCGHARLGHLSYGVVHDFAKLKMITAHGTLQTVPFCESCALVKRKTAPIPRTLHPRSDIPFSHVGIDFWENRKKSLQGHQYVFGATCYATSFSMAIYPMSRSEAPSCLHKLSSVAKSFGFSLRRIRLDNDTAFHLEAFWLACEQLSIRP